MNHTSLEIFKVVAEELSINRAARRVGRVQSNVTTRIQQLEEELEVQLFIRENRALRLSPQGKKFLTYAKRMLSLAEEARQSLHPHSPSGQLAFGAMECTAASRLTQPLATFSQACPAVRLSFTTLPTRQLTEKVQEWELDCALVALPADEEGEVMCPDGLACQPMFVERLMLLQAAEGCDAGNGRTARKLAAFVDGCTYREIALSLLAGGTGDRPPEVQAVGSYHAMLACVASGSYCCMLPQSVLELLSLPAGLSVTPAGTAVTQFIWRSESRSPAVESLRRTLLATSNMAEMSR
ncbi:LysR family transcriptional regulator [Serratia rhizosphaerae]